MQHRSAARLLSTGFAVWLAQTADAGAFPLIDPGNADTVPIGNDLAAPDAQALRHQLQLANGLPAGGTHGWVVTPRVQFEEMLSDNILQQHSPRRWDIVTYVAPGISITGDTPRVQMRFDYSPTLEMFARTASQNALSQRLNGTALITAWQEWAYVDVRALAGVQAANGGVGGLGGIGGAGQGTANAMGNFNTGTDGTTKQNRYQTASFGISPYLMHRFGEIGTAKLGYSMDMSRTSTTSGFVSLPFPTGGTGGQSLVTQEQIAQFTSGDRFEPIQNSLDVQMMQSDSMIDPDSRNAALLAASNANRSIHSIRQIFSDKVGYSLSHQLTVFATGGYENISYSGLNGTNTKGLTWNIGATWLPNPDSSITASYGHQQGSDSFQFNGRYALGARTTISSTYSSTLGTQLENLQRQLNASRVDASGALVDARTGAPTFQSTNGFAVQPGIYRFNTLTADVHTVLDRDSLNLMTTWTTQQSSGGLAPVGVTSDIKAVTLQWTRQMRPDMVLNTSLSYSLQNSSGQASSTSTSIAASASLQYILSDTVSTSLRYMFYKRSGGTLALQNMYQDMLILDITKQF